MRPTWNINTHWHLRLNCTHKLVSWWLLIKAINWLGVNLFLHGWWWLIEWYLLFVHRSCLCLKMSCCSCLNSLISSKTEKLKWKSAFLNSQQFPILYFSQSSIFSSSSPAHLPILHTCRLHHNKTDLEIRLF